MLMNGFKIYLLLKLLFLLLNFFKKKLRLSDENPDV